MLLRIEDEEELALFFEIMSLVPESEGMMEEERLVLGTVRWWLMTGQSSVDPYELAAPYPAVRDEVAARILRRLAAGVKLTIDGPSLSRARVASGLFRRNPELSKFVRPSSE
jgi:hypothetical protein